MDEVKLIQGGLSVDDRGSVLFSNDLNFQTAGIKRSYIVKNHKQGFRRAWHGHKNEAKYVRVIQGAILIGVADLETSKVEFRGVLSAEKPVVLYIPKGKANGFMSLTNSDIIEFYSTSTTQESLQDDLRFPVDAWDIWNIEER